MMRRLALPEGLSDDARALVAILDREAGKHVECWRSTAWLAAALGRCERTIRNLFVELAGFDLIDVVRDYALRTRRRIVLLFRGRRDAQVTANETPRSQDAFAVTNVSPQTPLYEVSEDEDLKGGGWCDAGTGVGECEGPTGPPPPHDPLDPQGSEPPPSDAPRKATPAEVAALDRLAAVALPDDGPAAAASFVRHLARQHTYSRTVAGLRRLRERVAEGGVRDRRRLLLRIVADFAVEGVPERLLGPISEAEIAGDVAPAAAIVAPDPERLRRQIEADEAERAHLAAMRAADEATERGRRERAAADARRARGAERWAALPEPERAAIRARVEAAHPALRRFAPMILQLCHEAAGGDA